MRVPALASATPEAPEEHCNHSMALAPEQVYKRGANQPVADDTERALLFNTGSASA